MPSIKLKTNGILQSPDSQVTTSITNISRITIMECKTDTICSTL